MIFFKKLRGVLRGNPVVVGIEITTECNRRCAYCPVSTHTRPKQLMGLDMFDGILNVLKASGFFGAIHLIGYGEPLLDNRIYELIRRTKKALPRNQVITATNGDLLDDKVKSDLADSGLDVLLVTRHSRSDFKAFKYMVGKMEVIEQPAVTQIANRVGSAWVKGLKYSRMWFCRKVLALFITASGDVCFCCDDYAARHGVGINVKTGNFLKEWNRMGLIWQRILVLVGFRFGPCKGCRVAQK